MKVATYSLLTLVFSALVLSPIIPKEYPTKEVLEKNQVITYKEQKLKRLIESVEYQITKDSLEIKSLKGDFN